MKTALTLALFAFICLYFFPYYVVADVIPPVPDITDWEAVSISRIEARVSDIAVIYIGIDAEYRNPNDVTEFVRVISRHIPLILFKQERGSERLFNEMVIALYAHKEEQDRLNELSKKTDGIVYVRWRIGKDLRTGKDIRKGDLDIWLKKSGGEWLFTQNEKMTVQLLSENIKSGERQHNVFVGREYRLGDYYHVLKVDRRDLIQVAEKKGEK